MKKSFWGYNIHEVDENMDYLEMQNIKLEKQVKQLSADLEKAKTELEFSTAGTGNIDAVNEESEKTINRLRTELDSVKTVYAQLKAENENLSAEIAQKNAEATERSEAFTEVGNICRLAYKDMHRTKQKTRESLEDFLASFWEAWKKYQQQVYFLSEQIKFQQEESRKSFIESADQILQTYGSMEQKNQTFNAGLSEIADISDRLQSQLESLLAEMNDENKTGDKGADFSDTVSGTTAENVVQEKIDTYSILQAIKTLSESRGLSEPYKEEILSEGKEEKADLPVRNLNEGFSISHKVNVRDII